MRHQTAMFSEANLLRFYNHWKHCIKYVIKTPVKYFISFRSWFYEYPYICGYNFEFSYHYTPNHHTPTTCMLQLTIIVWSSLLSHFWLSTIYDKIYIQYIGKSHMHSIIASSALFLLGLSGSRSRNMSQLAMFAHESHFSWATEIGFISSISLTLFLLLLIIPTFQLN